MNDRELYSIQEAREEAGKLASDSKQGRGHCQGANEVRHHS
jgi:hypothetical protein